METGRRLEPHYDTAGVREEEQSAWSGSSVGVPRSTDDERSHRLNVVIPHAANLVAGARDTAVDDSFHLGVSLCRRRRAAPLAAERRQRQLDPLTTQTRDPPSTFRLRRRRHPHRAADVAAVAWCGDVATLTTLRYRLGVRRTCCSIRQQKSQF